MEKNSTAAKHIKKYCYVIGLLSFLVAFFSAAWGFIIRKCKKRQAEPIWQKVL